MWKLIRNFIVLGEICAPKCSLSAIRFSKHFTNIIELFVSTLCITVLWFCAELW